MESCVSRAACRPADGIRNLTSRYLGRGSYRVRSQPVRKPSATESRNLRPVAIVRPSFFGAVPLPWLKTTTTNAPRRAVWPD
jgi:hypothetical protein